MTHENINVHTSKGTKRQHNSSTAQHNITICVNWNSVGLHYRYYWNNEDRKKVLIGNQATTHCTNSDILATENRTTHTHKEREKINEKSSKERTKNNEEISIRKTKIPF